MTSTIAEKTNLMTLRPMERGDRSFILATFLRGLYYGNSLFRLIPSKIFYPRYHDIVERLIDSPNSITMVACLKDAPEVVLGYSIVTNSTRLDWVFVKRPWRKIGIAKLLVPDTIQSVSHITEAGKSILAKHKNVVFDPFLN